MGFLYFIAFFLHTKKIRLFLVLQQKKLHNLHKKCPALLLRRERSSVTVSTTPNSLNSSSANSLKMASLVSNTASPPTASKSSSRPPRPVKSSVTRAAACANSCPSSNNASSTSPAVSPSSSTASKTAASAPWPNASPSASSSSTTSPSAVPLWVSSASSWSPVARVANASSLVRSAVNVVD